MTKTKTQTINYEKIACLSLFSLCVGFLVMYMYFLSASVVHVVIRKEFNQDVVVLSSEISELETQYIEAQHHVSDKIASMDGYSEVSEKIFIDRTADSLVLSR